MTLNGKKIYGYNSNTGNGVGHTFAIPTLGINVPLVGVPSRRHQRLQPGAVLRPELGDEHHQGLLRDPGPG